MTIYDITKELTSAPLYPGSMKTQVQLMCSMKEGREYNASNLHLSAHAGTHCDAYSHFVEDEKDIADMPIEHYIGACYVLTIPRDTVVDAPYFMQYLPEDVTRLLLKGGMNSFITRAAAEYLIDAGVITLGTEALSVAPMEDEAGVHVPLLSAHVAVIEQLELAGIADGHYMLFAPPLKIANCEGAPCRAILIEIEE